MSKCLPNPCALFNSHCYCHHLVLTFEIPGFGWTNKGLTGIPSTMPLFPSAPSMLLLEAPFTSTKLSWCSSTKNNSYVLPFYKLKSTWFINAIRTLLNLAFGYLFKFIFNVVFYTPWVPCGKKMLPPPIKEDISMSLLHLCPFSQFLLRKLTHILQDLAEISSPINHITLLQIRRGLGTSRTFLNIPTSEL